MYKNEILWISKVEKKEYKTIFLKDLKKKFVTLCNMIWNSHKPGPKQNTNKDQT